MSLRVVGQTFPTRPKGACIVEFDSLEQSFRGHVTIDWDPPSQTFGINVRDIGTSKTTAGIRELASQVVTVVHQKFPDAVITTIKPHYTPLGP